MISRLLYFRMSNKFRVGDECWEWIGARSSAGYGQLTFHGTRRYAHRIMYEWKRGPIPESTEIDHLCRNPACCRPDHLDAVTHQTNMQRGKNAQRTYCINGHAYTPENAYIRPSTKGRVCRVCTLEGQRRRRREGKNS